LSRGTWNQIQEVAPRLEEADRRADEVRATRSPIDDKFRAELDDLANKIGEATFEDSGSIATKINDAVVGARRLPKRLGLALALLFVAIIVASILVVIHKPTWSNDSLSRTLRTQTPGAQIAACDASTQLEGAYTCAVTFPPCALGPVSAKPHAACSPPLLVTYSVETHGSCYIASRTAEVVGADPPPTFFQKLLKFAVRSGCKKG
jgi:hypothetical protein